MTLQSPRIFLLKKTTDMKLLMIGCLAEEESNAKLLLRKAGIRNYSTFPVIEYDENQEGNLIDGWFALDKEHANSIIFMCFADDATSEGALSLIKEEILQNSNEQKSGIRAYLMDVLGSTIY